MHRGLTMLLACSALCLARPALPEDTEEKEEEAPKPWCAPELEVLDGDVCHWDAGEHDGKRTLVIFLHGLVQDGAGWQHNQQRGLVRGGKRLHFSVITPKGKLTTSHKVPMIAWPTSPDSRAKHEAELVAQWQSAIDVLEERHGKPFDEIFVVGFSNGAYYASSLVMRAPLDRIDGYAVFAGGSPYSQETASVQKKPIFIGICAKDNQSAPGAKKLQKHLKKLKWPHEAESRRVGHAIADVHLDHALAYLRKQKNP